MIRKLLLFMITLASVATTPVYASVKLDYTTVETVTKRCFMEQKWDSVIVIGKKALHQHIDYYYLRLRMGISYYQKAEYFPAIIHLKKARHFNSSDPMAGDYLYRAYFYTNHNEEARLLRASMPREDRDTVLDKTGFVEQVHVESGYTISSDKSPSNLSTLMGKDSIYGERDLYGNSLYSNLGLKLRVSNRVGISIDYNYLNFTKTKYIQYIRNEDHLQSISDTSWGKNYNYSFPWVIHDTSFTYHVMQHEAYVNASVALPFGIKIIPAFHWLHVSYTMVNPSYTRDTVSDTAFFTNYNSTYHTFPFTRLTYSYARKDTSFNNYVASLRISKDLGRLTLALTGSWSDLNGKTQKQAGLSLTYFPFGNFNIYGSTSITGFMQGSDSRLLYSQVLGLKCTRWMWAEANFYYGNFTNSNILNGSVVYNNNDIIDYRGAATLVFMAGRHLQFSLIYQYFHKESQQLYYEKVQNPDTHAIKETPQYKNNPYNTNTIIGGITWKL